MPSTYVHLSGKEVDDAILTMNGIKNEEKKEEHNFKPIMCPRCDTINAVDSKHCNKCGGILDMKYAMELEDVRTKELDMREKSDKLMAILLSDKAVQEIIMDKLKGMGVSLPF
jgi:ribosomal protein L40E